MVRAATRFCIAAVPFVLLAGCGGDSASTPVAPAAPAPAAPAPVPAKVAAPAAPKAAKKSAASSQTQNAPTQAALPPGTDPADVFEIMDPPQFEIVEESPTDDSNLFAVAIPPEGIDSSSFAVTLPTRAAATQRSTAKLPDGFVALPEFGFAEDGRPLRIRCEKDDSVMAYIPAGTSHLGTSNGPREASPEITVYTDAYYIDVTEVTLEQFSKYRDDSKTSKKRIRPEALNAKSPPNHPALGITWGEARFYAHWAGKELPTEAQWERAGRGNNSFERPWGNDRAVWPQARSPKEITAVMSYRGDVSPFGVYDLAGNAREWCLDWYSDRAYTDAGKSGSATLRNWEGPKSPSSPNLRVVKGGSPEWNLWHRAGLNVSHEDPTVGFRCVLKLPAEEPEADTKKARAGR